MRVHIMFVFLMNIQGPESIYKTRYECYAFIVLYASRTPTPQSSRLRAGRLKGRSSSPARVKNFLVQTGSGVHPIYSPMGTGGSFPGGKVAGAWNWPLTASADVKKMWISTSTPPYAFMA
jgi:hypothetical protein